MARPFGPAKTREMRVSRGTAWKTLAKLPVQLRRAPLWRDESGATAMIVGLGATMLVGFAGIGTEMGVWYFNHRNLQNATDSAAMSAETAIYQGSVNYAAEAKGTAARYGFVDGTGGVTVTVNRPPKSGAFVGNADDVEVIISEPQARLFTAMFSNKAIAQTARSVAQIKTNGNGCVVTLDKGTVVDLFDNGNTQLNLVACDLYINSNAGDALDQVGNATIDAHAAYVVGGVSVTARASLTTTAGTYTGVAPTTDPYANVVQPTPSSCSSQSLSNITSDVTLSPGTYCGGLNATGGTITLNPGVYVFDGGNFQASGNANIVGSGVTIFLTGSGSNYSQMQVTGNATMTISPPTTGDTAGISIFQDRNAPSSSSGVSTGTTDTGIATTGGNIATTGGVSSGGTSGTSLNVSPSTTLNNNQIGGNGAINVTGVVYFPNQQVTWNGNGTGGSPHCSQLVALTLTFHGNSQFQSDCAGVPGVVKIGAIPARLVE
ncbi:MAG TPA: Tad domain-containing protein [Stellaceae bacterium]|nr:Tad domain-containing protein [Stellaceae bacterium]